MRPEAAAPWIASGLQPLRLLGVGRGSHMALQSGGGSWAKLLERPPPEKKTCWFMLSSGKLNCIIHYSCLFMFIVYIT